MTKKKADNPGLCLGGEDSADYSNVVIDIALMAEDMPRVHQDCATTRYLAPIDVTWNQFHNLFYFKNGTFTPNTTLGCVCPFDQLLGHDGKVISDAGGRSKDYTLMNELLEHYTEHLDESPLCWDVCSRVEFEKKVSTIKSLFDVGVCNVKCSLSLDEFFNTLGAHGVEISDVTGMPTISAQKKKVVALVTTKFISHNSGGEDGVPDLNICWPFRVDFRACIAAPMGRGCCTPGLLLDMSPEERNCGKLVCVDPCKQNPLACNSDAYGVDDGACKKHNEKGTALTLADILSESGDLFRCSGVDADDLCDLIPKLKNSPTRALYPCINNLDMSELCKLCCVGAQFRPFCWPYLLGADCSGTSAFPVAEGEDCSGCGVINILDGTSGEGDLETCYGVVSEGVPTCRKAKMVVEGPEGFQYTVIVVIQFTGLDNDGDGFTNVDNTCCVTPKCVGTNIDGGESITIPKTIAEWEVCNFVGNDPAVVHEADAEFCKLLETYTCEDFRAVISPYNDEADLPGPTNGVYNCTNVCHTPPQAVTCADVCERKEPIRCWTWNGCVPGQDAIGGWCGVTKKPCEEPKPVCEGSDCSGCVLNALKADNIASPWSCTDWCPGDRYRTSYETATWKLVCDPDCAPDTHVNKFSCAAEDEDTPVVPSCKGEHKHNPNAVGNCCNVIVAYNSPEDNVALSLTSDDCNDKDPNSKVLLPSDQNNAWRWHQVCCDVSDDCNSGGGECYNIIGSQQFCPPVKKCGRK